MALKLKIVVGSTRPGRVAPVIAGWVADFSRQNSGFDVEIADLADLDLPLYDEPKHPKSGEYAHEHTRRWAAIAGEADALIFVTPEYDSFPPAALINAIQYLVLEWDKKPAAIVSYGGVSGGLRAGQALRQLLSSVGMVPIPQGVPIPFFPQFVEDGALTPNQPMTDGAKAMLAELEVLASGLKSLRDAPVEA
ncbi:NADPH-dependent FMN reductase [Aquicoccus sp. SCR17]|nr:NADPH-dependent FMN reductase [Carideicomes alvinocaridis]